MKVSVLGSCLSNLTAARLIGLHGWEQVHCVHHNRSDTLLKYHIYKSGKMIPMELLDKLLVDKKPAVAGARDILLNQSEGSIGLFQLQKTRDGKPRDFWQELATEETDAILMDNFMDIAAKLVFSKSLRFGKYANSPLFLNSGFYANAKSLNRKFEFIDFLTARESAQYSYEVFKHLRRLQPQAKIYFLCFQYDTSTDSQERLERARAFYPEFLSLAKDDDLKIMQPISAPDALKVEGDWTHFKDAVYERLAAVLHNDICNDNVPKLEKSFQLTFD